MILNIDEGRYSRRAVSARNRFFKSFLFILVLCAVSYKFGVSNVKSHEEANKQQMEDFLSEKSTIESTITMLRSEIQSSDMRLQQLQEQYDADIPKGNHKYLSDLVKHQLDLGIAPDRLAYLIRSTRPPQNCTKPVIKRFVMATPTYSGPKSSVSFANGAIEVIGEGESAVSSSGKQAAWYDPSKPIKVSFKTTGGKSIEKEGLLPIYHSIVMGGKEYRFTLAEGEQSFINITSDYCDYP